MALVNDPIVLEDIPVQAEVIQPTRDDVFYIQTVIFRVGNSLFRVPRNAFNVPGTIFEAMFALPPTQDSEGSTDENPIVLQVDEDSFRAFLRVICGPRGHKIAHQDWLLALGLATMWTFDDLREEAIQTLTEWSKTQTLKDVILTAKNHNIVSWLKFAYSQIVILPTFPFDDLTADPAVDWETVARLLYVALRNLSTRNTYGYNYDNYGCSQCRTGKICCSYVDPSIDQVFQDEFERVEHLIVKDPPLPGPKPGNKKPPKKRRRKA